MKTPEAHLKDYVKRRLKEHNAYFFMPVQTGYGMPTLDFLCSIDGNFLGVETKAEGKKPIPRQLLVIKQIQNSGGWAFWCDSREMFDKEMLNVGWPSQ